MPYSHILSQPIQTCTVTLSPRGTGAALSQLNVHNLYPSVIEDDFYYYRYHMRLAAIARHYYKTISSHPDRLLIESNVHFRAALNLKLVALSRVPRTHLHNRA